MNANFDFVDEEDCRQLLLNFLQVRGRPGMTADEGFYLLEQFQEAEIASHLFRMAIQGRIEVDVCDGELMWRAPDNLKRDRNQSAEETTSRQMILQ